MTHKHHKFKKIDIGRDKPWPVYKCVLPGCRRKVPIAQMEGELALCWQCGNGFPMDAATMQMRPRCRSCKVKHPYHKSKAPSLENVDVSSPIDALLAAVLPKQKEQP